MKTTKHRQNDRKEQDSAPINLHLMITEGPLDRTIYNLLCRLVLDGRRYETLMNYALDTFVLFDREHIDGPFGTYEQAMDEGRRKHGTEGQLFLVQNVYQLQEIVTLIRDQKIELP